MTIFQMSRSRRLELPPEGPYQLRNLWQIELNVSELDDYFLDLEAPGIPQPDNLASDTPDPETEAAAREVLDVARRKCPYEFPYMFGHFGLERPYADWTNVSESEARQWIADGVRRTRKALLTRRLRNTPLHESYLRESLQRKADAAERKCKERDRKRDEAVRAEERRKQAQWRHEEAVRRREATILGTSEAWLITCHHKHEAPRQVVVEWDIYLAQKTLDRWRRKFPEPDYLVTIAHRMSGGDFVVCRVG